MTLLSSIQRRWKRQRRRRTVGRAYDMALEIARRIPVGSRVLDVGCGNGYIGHHLSAMLRTSVVGLDVSLRTAATIDYLPYDGRHFPVQDHAFDVVLLCYVLHHAQDARLVLNEVIRVLVAGGTAIVYEDIPKGGWNKLVCWSHNRRWEHRSGPCSFRLEEAWRGLFNAAGFEVLIERPLSRWRNVAHPVTRRFYVLKADNNLLGIEGARLRTDLATSEAIPAYAAAL